MSVKVDLSGLEKFKKKVENLSNEKSVQFDDLFNSSFMRKHTRFSNINDFFIAGGFKIGSAEDFKAIPDEDLDNYISTATAFKSWEDMQKEAATSYFASKLGF